MAEENVTGVARLLEIAVGAHGQDAVADHPDHGNERHDEKDGPRKPPEIDRAADQDGEVHCERGRILGRPAKPRDVVGESGEDTRDPHVLEMAERRGEDLAAEVATEICQRALREAVEQKACHCAADDLGRYQPREAHDKESPREVGTVERGVDQRDESRAAGAADEPGHDRPSGRNPRARGDEDEETHAHLHVETTAFVVRASVSENNPAAAPLSVASKPRRDMGKLMGPRSVGAACGTRCISGRCNGSSP